MECGGDGGGGGELRLSSVVGEGRKQEGKGDDDIFCFVLFCLRGCVVLCCVVCNVGFLIGFY